MADPYRSPPPPTPDVRALWKAHARVGYWLFGTSGLAMGLALGRLGGWFQLLGTTLITVAGFMVMRSAYRAECLRIQQREKKCFGEFARAVEQVVKGIGSSGSVEVTVDDDFLHVTRKVPEPTGIDR